MEQSNEYPKYRWVIAVIFIFVSMLDLFFMMVTAPIMTILVKDLNSNLTMIGYASTLVTAMCGVFLFIGVIFVSKWGVKKSFIIGTAFLALGNFLCGIAGTVGTLLLGRALVGIGFGITGSLVAAVVFMWFPSKERPMLFTVNALACNAAMLICLNVIIPMYNALGSWKAIFMICTGLSVLGMLLWIFLGKEYNPFPNQTPDSSVKEKTDPFAGIKLAFKSKELWILAVMMTCLTVMQYGLNFFYPTFLNQIRGLGAAAASSVTSVQFIAGVIGTFLGGVVAVALGRRKLIIIPACVITLASLLGLFMFKNTIVLITMMVAFGFIFNFRNPAAQTASTEVKGMNPAMASGANSMIYGFGSLFTLFISPILGGLQNSLGLTGAMLAFCAGLTLIGTIASFFIRETGPKAKAKA